MATKGGSKMFWIIGGLIVVAGSVGAYFLLRKPKDENKGEGDTDTDTDTNVGGGNVGGGNVGGGSATYTAPSDLNDSTKIKAFQDWLDANKPCWLLDSDGKYKNLSKNAGACNRNAGGTGYGSYGKNTDTAWRSFGTEYLSKKGTTPASTKNTPSEDDINLILKKATGFKSDRTVLQGKPASWVKDWADAIRDSRRTFFWTKNEGGNNKTYKVVDGTILLDYVPVGTTYYASKGGDLSKEEAFNSASAGNINKGQNLGKAGDVTYDGKYVYVYFPSKGGYKWVYESAITSKNPTSSFSGSDMDLDMFASFDNNLDLNL